MSSVGGNPFRGRRRQFKKTSGMPGRQVATKSYVKKVIRNRKEKKFKDSVFNSTVTDTGSIVHLSSIAQGNTERERSGNRIKSVGWEYRLQTIVNDATNIVRIIIFQDSSSGGAFATVAEVLQSAEPLSFYEDTNVPGRFRILSDRTVTLAEAGANQVQFIHRSGKLSTTMTFDGTSTDPFINSLYMLLISDSGVSGPLTDAIIRYWYTDS